MKKKKLIMFLSTLVFFVVGSELAEAKPIYTNQSAKTYFNELLNEAISNGYKDQGTGNQQIELVKTGRVTKINREVLNDRFHFDAQFYMGYAGVEYSNIKARPGVGGKEYSLPTFTIQQKLNYVRDAVEGQSQMLYPQIKTRVEGTSSVEHQDLLNSPVQDSFYQEQHSYPQGFMYAESDRFGSEIKQFVYGKDADHFRSLWNPKTESLMFIAMEGERNPDKIMVVRADVDEIYRYIKVSGELFYFGSDNKQFTVLNQMVYDNDLRTSEAYETYGKNKGLLMPNTEKNANLVIRTDLVDGPQNWTVTQHPFEVKKTGEFYDNSPATMASMPDYFLEGFNPETLNGTGIESDSKNHMPGVKLTQGKKLTYHFINGQNKYEGDYAINSVKMKSKSANLKKGQSLKLEYGFEPTTRYKVPAIIPISDTSKNEQDILTTRVKWMDAVKNSTGGEMEFFVNDEPVEVTIDDQVYTKYRYDKDNDVEGEFFVTIDSKYFLPGVSNLVRIEMKDEILLNNPQGVKPDEHSSTREFRVDNKRFIPISYITSKGTKLQPNENATTYINVMDNDKVGTVVSVPPVMTDKSYPLYTVDPDNDFVKLDGTNLTVKGNENLSSGIKVVYKVLNVDGKVKMIDVNSGKAIFKDLVNTVPVKEHVISDLEIGKPLKPIIEAEKNKPVDNLVTEYQYYSLVKTPEYEIIVNGKPLLTDVVPEFDFDIVYKYEGEVGFVKVPELKFGAFNVSNNSDVRNFLINKEGEATVGMYNTVNSSDKKMTVELKAPIEKEKINVSDKSMEYNGQLRYSLGNNKDESISQSPIEILHANKSEMYKTVDLKGNEQDKTGIYLVQFPGNYGGNYKGTLVWKIVEDITK